MHTVPQEMEAVKEAPTSHNVQVYVRIRPINSKEQSQAGGRTCLEQGEAPGAVTILTRPEPKTFSYDHVAGDSSTQEDVFQNVGKPISDTCVAGYNGTIFAYGQTGSGKTHTIQGSQDSNQRGLMPRVFEYLCSQIARKERITGPNRIKYTIKASFLEIYNERIYDLLEPQSQSLNIREDTKKGTYVENLSQHPISNAADCMQVMNTGVQNRRIGETAMNRESSRSHCVFCLHIQSEEISSEGIKKTRHSRFNMIDLAGSERQSATKAAGERLKEASQINKSLSALGNVIMSLVEVSRSGRERHVHYRDSKLTFLLKDSLGGNSLTYIIACVSPSSSNVGETLSTLKFAARAKFIKNKAVINEDQTGTLKGLQDENAKLQQMVKQLKALQAANGRRMSLGFNQKFQSPGKKMPGMSSIDEQAPDDSLRMEMVKDSLNREKEWQLVINRLKRDMSSLEDLTDKQQKQILSSNMLLRLRNVSIEELRKAITGDGSVSEVDASNIARLKQEMEILQQANKINPELVRKVMKINSLQDRVEDLEGPGKPTSSNIAESFKVAERCVTLSEENAKLKAQCQTLKEQMANPDKLLEAMTTPQKRKFESFELEKWKQEQAFEKQLQLVQEELIAARSQLETACEEKGKTNTKLKEVTFELEEVRSASDILRLRHEMEKKKTAKLHEQALRQALEAQVAKSEEQNGERSLEVALITAQLETSEEENRSLAEQTEKQDSELSKLREALRMVERQLNDSEEAAKASALELDELRLQSGKNLSEKKTALAKLEQSAERVKELEMQFQSSKLEREEMDKNVQNQASAITHLESELDSKTSQLDRLQFNFTMLEEDAECTMQDLEFQQNHAGELSAQVEGLKSDLAKANQAQQQASEKIANQTEMLSSMKEEMTQLTADNTEMKDVMLEKQQLRELIQLTQEEMGLIQDQLNDSLEETRVANAKILVASKDNSTLETSLQELATAFRSSQERLASATSSLASSRTEYQSNLILLEDKEKEVQDHKHLISEMQSEINAGAANLDSVILSYEVDIRGLRGAMEAMNAQLDGQAKKIKQQQTQLEAATHSNSALQDELESTMLGFEHQQQQEKTAHLEVVKQLEENLSGLGVEYEAEVHELQARLSAEETERLAMSSRSNMLTGRLAEVESIKENVTAEAEELRARLAGVNTVLTELQSTGSVGVSESNNSIGSILRTTIADMETKRTQLDDQLSQLRQEFAGKVESLQTLQGEHTQLLSEAEALKEQSASTQMRASQVEAALAESQASLNKLKSDHAAREAKYTLLLESLEKLNAQKSQEISRLRAQFASMKSENDNTVEAMAELRKYMAEVETSLKQAEQDKKNLAVDTAAAQEKLSAAEELVEVHKGDADAQTFEAARLTAELDALQKKLKKSLQDKHEWLDEMHRCKAEEERAFTQNETMREEIENLKNSNSRCDVKIADLENDNLRLNKLNAKLSGHQNTRQKIQHHMQIKRENDALKQDKLSLQKENKKLRRALGSKADSIAASSAREDEDAMLAKLKTSETSMQDLMTKINSITTEAIGTENFTDDAFKSLLLGVEAPSKYDLRNKKSAQSNKEASFDSTLRNVENLIIQVKDRETKLKAAERKLESNESKIRMLEKARQLQDDRMLLENGAGFTDLNDFQDAARLFTNVQSPLTTG